ncbi:WD40/YVTN/BNR-like repeat-containing protein [Flavobacterium sp.]|uniref:WD40/YVTN/BNR-like repeat-containing protein n=1 Tax=Flavobacterium sp. TaxID=239 RepID=UPI003F69F812
MKKKILIFFIFLIISCSKSIESNELTDVTSELYPVIENYSTDLGYSGDEITIYGTNFTNDISKIDLKFEYISSDSQIVLNAQIIECSINHIVVKLPAGFNCITDLRLLINGRQASISDSMPYLRFGGRIGILDNTPNVWHKIEDYKLNPPSGYGNSASNKIIVVGDAIYYSFGGDSYYSSQKVYKILDGGLTFRQTGKVDQKGNDFYITENHDGFYSLRDRFVRYGIDPNVAIDIFQFPYLSANSYFNGETNIVGIYVSNDLSITYLIDSNNRVYTSNDGVNFTRFTQAPFFNTRHVYCTSFLNENNLWYAGRKNGQPILQSGAVISYGPYQPYIAIIKNGVYNQIVLNNSLYSNFSVNKISFINENIGFLNLIKSDNSNSKLMKTSDGGQNWSLVNDDVFMTNFCFKDENTGWYCYQNKIYKTIDGGVNWSLDYCCDSNMNSIINIAYKNGVVYAIQSERCTLLKYFTY